MRTRRLYQQKGVSQEEMLLNDIVQAFEETGLQPSISGSGYWDLGSPHETCALGVLFHSELAHGHTKPGGSSDWMYGDGPVADLNAWYGWDHESTDNFAQEATDAAWRVMHDTDTERRK